MKQGTSQELYKQAHDNHYKSKNIRRAYALYALVTVSYTHLTLPTTPYV